MDTTITGISITDKQVTNINTLAVDPVKGFSYWPSETKVVVVSTRALSQEELDALKVSILALPDTYSQDALNSAFSFKTLMGTINQEMSSESILKLSPYTGALQSFCDWYNWEGVGDFLDALVADGTMTAEERTQIVAIFLQQEIVIP